MSRIRDPLIFTSHSNLLYTWQSWMSPKGVIQTYFGSLVQLASANGCRFKFSDLCLVPPQCALTRRKDDYRSSGDENAYEAQVVQGQFPSLKMLSNRVKKSFPSKAREKTHSKPTQLGFATRAEPIFRHAHAYTELSPEYIYNNSHWLPADFSCLSRQCSPRAIAFRVPKSYGHVDVEFIKFDVIRSSHRQRAAFPLQSGAGPCVHPSSSRRN